MALLVALVVVLLLSPAFVARSGAAALAPKRASDLRTVTNFGRQHRCPSLVLGFAVDTVQNPDGTNSPFVVPPGSVFVVTGWEWADCESNANNLPLVVSLFIDNGVTLTQAYLGLSAGTTTSTSTTNCSGGAVQVPGGAVVNSGATLCFGDDNGSVIVHGFIARDN
jgi:hypothetical protein